MNYWSDFLQQYASLDTTGILKHARAGTHNDIFISEASIKQLFDQPVGIQFGIAKGDRPDHHKIEIRKVSEGDLPDSILTNLATIKERIAQIGGDYDTESANRVVNCYFTIPGDTEATLSRTFQFYQQFRDIILDYYLERKQHGLFLWP